ncbi:hypothetical protein OG735_39800 [Streptomyces sp. NBC_01210]|uniref:hypothetical protein n=1 Tax=Streptomyces sp. NBC_01210 TaxID=2903774 RepID=UPI002E14485A|nr:hypothetical protein OG735_39800 [Streptomyces sp. NBC_01210]
MTCSRFPGRLAPLTGVRRGSASGLRLRPGHRWAVGRINCTLTSGRGGLPALGNSL